MSEFIIIYFEFYFGKLKIKWEQLFNFNIKSVYQQMLQSTINLCNDFVFATKFYLLLSVR